MAKMSSPTETEQYIESLIVVFQKFAEKESNNCMLSKKDFGVLDHMMKKLDLNSDGQLDFQAFLNLLGGVAMACHDSFLRTTHFQE
ncbi:unnamed protein product [Nyctereutes procyonoides]|uniref:(raccoon dog) hypothetical protein n=1 Tax=Nyctereutes procyonoides TaxID=34880 RepID=A0A811YHR2_NYCPR|nr:unnamed protein product [Nyctereutes procyonoides]